MKQPNWKVPFVLAFSLLALASFAYWLQYSHKPKKEKTDTLAKKPIALPKEDSQIVQFRIKGAANVIEGRCDSIAKKNCNATALADWTLTYPATLKGDPATIKEMLNNATTMIATDTIDLSDETPEKRAKLLDEYGLSTDKRTKMGTEFIELTLDDGHKLAAWFGEPYPMGDKIFVGSTDNGNMNEKTVFIVANFYKSVFEKNLTHFRDKTVLSFNHADITDITSKTTTGKYEAHLENGTWVINGKHADRDRIEALLTALSSLKAKEFPGVDELKGARSIVTVNLKSKAAPYSIELFEKTSKDIKIKGHEPIPGESHYYVRASGLNEPVEVEALLRSQIDKKVGDLRYGLLINETEKATATQLKFEGKGFAVPAEFKYDGKAWVQKDSGPKMSIEKITSFLITLASQRADDFVSPAPAVSGQTVTVSIGDEKNPEKTHFQVYSIKDKTYVKDLTQTTHEAMLLNPNEKNAFPFSPDSWKVVK